jgi:steroid 5-alpha reductase family enzyme
MGKLSTKTKLLLACLLAYGLGLAAAIAAFFWFQGNSPFVIAAVADLAATIIVFAFSIVFNNSSIYDPYWSIAPVPIALFWAFRQDAGMVLQLRQLIVLFLLAAWAFRLTFHCLRRWDSLRQEDWRYSELRPRAGRFYWPLSFLGFHLFPTVIVFLGCLSLYPVLFDPANRFGILDMFAILVTVLAIGIEAEADRELKAFRSNPGNRGLSINSGLWAYSRHPNYFGEVLFWWGLYLFGLAADIGYWWTIIGPLAVTALFMFVSVPMMDRHMLGRRESYSENMRRIPALIPWFPRG